MNNWLKTSLVLLTCCGTTWLGAELQFPNPSLEEDTANIGVPDGWSIHRTAVCKLDNKKVSHGVKALRIEAGYSTLSCDLKAPKLPGLKLRISFDAAGTPDARLGVIIGKMLKDRNGKLRWHNSLAIWNRQLTTDYKKIKIDYVMPPNATQERIFFGIYRLGKSGTIWVDNFDLKSYYVDKLTPEQKKQLVNNLREWSFLLRRVEQALRQLPGNPQLRQIQTQAQAIHNRLENDNVAMLAPQYPQLLTQYRCEINALLLKNQQFFAYLSDAYQRNDPAGLIAPVRPQTFQLSTLGNEYQAIGICVASGSKQGQKLPIQVLGGDNALERIQIRRQIFMKNWYERDKNLTADPLTLLPGANRNWELELPAGAVEKLYVGLKFKKQLPAAFPLTLKVGEQTLKVQVKPRPTALPTKPFFGNFLCYYMWLPPAPIYGAPDMAEHYVNAIEFTEFPKVKFTPDGTLATKINLPLKQIQTYAKHNIKLALFWQPGYRFRCTNGKFIELTVGKKLNPVWLTAYKNLLRAYFAELAQHGFNESHFLNWCWDELSSGPEWQTAPGSRVHNAVQIYRASKEVLPKLERMITASPYTLWPDYQAFIDDVDIVLPHWPMPEKLRVQAPADYNPRTTFFNQILPFLHTKSQANNLQLWSYKVDAGKGEKVLNTRIQPLCAASLGLNSVSNWAYNVTRNYTSWEDTDGGLLDYIFVYNGQEKHPLNAQYNIAREKVVPSIRWEALRMGIQDAKILVFLKSQMEQGQLPAAKAKQVQSILKELQGYAQHLNYTWDAVNRISKQLRNLI